MGLSGQGNISATAPKDWCFRIVWQRLYLRQVRRSIIHVLRMGINDNNADDDGDDRLKSTQSFGARVEGSEVLNIVTSA